MKKIFPILALAGCTTMGSQPITMIHKTGSSYQQRVQAFDSCKIASFRAIPQALQTNISGGFSNPGTVQCNTFGASTTCNTVGAMNIPAQSYTTDMNDDMRARFINQCLNDKGYQLIGAKTCSSEDERNAAIRQASNQPTTDKIKCVSTPTLDRGFLF